MAAAISPLLKADSTKLDLSVVKPDKLRVTYGDVRHFGAKYPVFDHDLRSSQDAQCCNFATIQTTGKAFQRRNINYFL
jgi:hypothetical protein